MTLFKNKKIKENKDYITNALKQARQEKNLSLKSAAQKLNINISYLEAIEAGDFESLPEGLYGSNFLRQYAYLLKIDSVEILKMYDQITSTNKNKSNELFSHKKPRTYLFFTAPKILKNLIITAIIIICVAYLGYYVYNIVSPPDLIIIYPPDNLTTSEKHIKIEGKTEKEAKIIINKEVVLTGVDGFFDKTIALKTGINTIVISAQKKYSQKNNIIKNILVENES